MPDVEYMLGVRESARRAGDRGIYLAMTADLARIGYVDPAPAAVERVVTAAGLETAAVRAPERAVPKPAAPKRRGGRPPLPRCPHGHIAGRCSKCKTAA